MRSIAIPIVRFAAGVALALAGGSNAALAQGAPTVRVIEEPVVVQPPPFATRGETVVVPRTRIEIDEGNRKPKSPSGEARPRKKAKSATATKDAVAAAPNPNAARANEAAPVTQPPPFPPAREIAPRKGAGKSSRSAAGKSKILSGDALGRKQKKEADNTDGED